METANSEVVARLNLMEERCATLEQRMLEAQQRQNDTMQRINHKNEKFNMSVEQLKFDGGQQSSNVTSIATKLQDVEASVKTGESELREANEKSQRQVQEEMKSTREAIISEYNRKLELLENKLAARIEREGEARQESLTVTVENVNAVLKREGIKEIPAPKPKQPPLRATPQTAVPEAGRGGSHTMPRLVPTDNMTQGTAAVRTTRTPTGSTIVMAGQQPVVMAAPTVVMAAPPQPQVVQTGSGLVMPGGAAPVYAVKGSSATVPSPVTSVIMAPAPNVQRVMSGSNPGPVQIG